MICLVLKAFSSEVGSGSRQENESKMRIQSPVLIQSEPEKLWQTRKALWCLSLTGSRMAIMT
jgi:hypothetical protein